MEAGQDSGSGSGGGSASGSMSDVAPAGMPVPGLHRVMRLNLAVSRNTSNSFNAMSADQLQQRLDDTRQQGAGFGGGGRFRDPGVVAEAQGSEAEARWLLAGGVLTSIARMGRYTTARSFGAENHRRLLWPAGRNRAYFQNSFGGSVGGPLNIPHIYHGGEASFFTRSTSTASTETIPLHQFSTMPTLAERQGNFSFLCKTGFTSAGVCNDRDSNNNVIDQIYSVNPTTVFAHPTR